MNPGRAPEKKTEPGTSAIIKGLSLGPMSRAHYLKAVLETMMFRCLNWGDPCCRPRVRAFIKRVENMGRRAKRQNHPSLRELERLNEICRSCPASFFEIQRKECPVCGSRRVEANLSGVSDSPPLYSYRCGSCGRFLFSSTKLNGKS
jgi:hypothetical protein